MSTCFATKRSDNTFCSNPATWIVLGKNRHFGWAYCTFHAHLYDGWLITGDGYWKNLRSRAQIPIGWWCENVNGKVANIVIQYNQRRRTDDREKRDMH